jgi:hypothetical protein
MPSHPRASRSCSRLAVGTSPSPELRTHSPILPSRCVFFFTSTHAQPGAASSIQARVWLRVDNEHAGRVRCLRPRGSHVDERDGSCGILSPQSLSRSADRPKTSEVLLSRQLSEFCHDTHFPSRRGGSSEMALTLFLFRALKSGLRLAPFAKLSFTAVSSLHRSLVNT